jgi:tripartite ATP-independent transporter DctM subunit
MDPVLFGVVLIVVLLSLLATGLWIGLSLIVVAWVAIMAMSSAPAGKVLATSMWQMLDSWDLTALPLFIWMGEILYRTRLAADMFDALAPWLSRLPGRLMHINVAGCGIFAAVSGSSAATAATIGRMTLPELARRGYDRDLSLGSLASSGSLGILIPPSIPMIVYGVAAQVSIVRLFMAGVLPGLLLMALFMAYIAAWSALNPARTPQEAVSLSIAERIRGTRRLLPVLLLIVAVIGTIYTGVATPTEAAAVGVLGALLVSLLSGSLNVETFKASIAGAVRTNCMVCLLLAASAFLSMAMGFTGLPRKLSEWITGSGLSATQLIAVLTLFYIVLGCFLDGISMIVLTVSVVLPSIQKAGIDTLWFGIFVIIVVEMAQVTPPVGFNLFVVEGITGESMMRIARASLPFFLLMIAAVAILMAFPQIVSLIPDSMTKG